MADWWTDRPWRLIQTNLREIDMRDISAERVVSDLGDFKANALMLNAAGIIASYPTELPFHFQSPFLTGDSLTDIIDACHRNDIRVIARTDFSKIRRPIYEKHPDWAYRTADGRIVDYNGDVHACINGPYQQERMFEILQELFTTHKFDGVFFNMGGYQTRDYSGNYHGPCHCESCERRFREMFGLALPTREDRADPVCRRYAVFKRRTQEDLARRLDEFLRSVGPGLCIAGNLGARRGFIRQESNTAVDRPLPRWQYSAADNTKWAVSSYPEMVSSNTTVDFLDIPYRHVAVSPHQQALRLAQNLANGGGLDYYLIGRLDNHEDRSGFAAVREVFHYHAAHEEAYRAVRSCAEIALLDGGRHEYRGWFRILVENHFLFDSLRPAALPDVALDRYRALVLPDLEQVGAAAAARLDGFVRSGGVLVATGRTSFRDEDDEPRARPALACLGIDEVEHVAPKMRGAYLALGDKTGFARFAETDLAYLDGPYVFARYAEAAAPRMKLVPPHHYGPPERCYYELVVDRPGLVVHPFGRGKAVYVPWLPGALFYRQGFPNTSDFAADLLEGVAGLAPVKGDLSPMVEVTLFENGQGARLLHLVNASGHFGNSFVAPVPMDEVEVDLPWAAAPASARSLRRDAECEFSWADGRLHLLVERLELFEAILVE